jgi:hypothetical protein
MEFSGRKISSSLEENIEFSGKKYGVLRSFLVENSSLVKNTGFSGKRYGDGLV